MRKYCAGCHATGVKMGGLELDTYDQMMRGGAHGRDIVPGKASESRLYLMIAGKMTPAMPADNRKLTDGELSIMERWINAGAPGPAPGSAPAIETTTAPRIAPKSSIAKQIFSVAYSPDGRLLALGGFREVRLVDAATGKQQGKLEGQVDSVRALAFSADGKWLAAAGGLATRKGEVQLWDMSQALSPRLARTIQGHSDCIYAVAISPDGHSIATSSYDKLIKLWDTVTGNEIRTLKDHIDAIYALAFTPDGKRLVSGAADRTVKIWDPSTGERLYTLSEPSDGINAIALDPTGRMVAAGGLDKSIRIWRLGERGGELVSSAIAHEDAILALAWSPDGKHIVSSAADKTIKIFSAPDLVELHMIPHQADWVYSLQFSPDGRTFAAGRYDGSLSIYDSAQYQDRLEVRRAQK